MEYAATLAPSSFLQRVFAWMFVGLLVTAGAAALIGAGDSLLTDITEDPVAIFAGLTAYDVQKIKRYEGGQGDAIRGALSLYLDFINMFLSLLRIFGQGRG